MSVYCHVKGEACIVSSFPLHVRTSMLIVQLMLWCLSAPSNIWHLQPCDCTRSCGSNGAEWKKAQRGSLWLFITAQSPLTGFPPLEGLMRALDWWQAAECRCTRPGRAGAAAPHLFSGRVSLKMEHGSARPHHRYHPSAEFLTSAG